MALVSLALLARQVAQAPAPTGESRAPTLYGFMGAFGPLALIAVVLRLYTRFKFAKIGADDVAITAGFVLFTGLIIATVFAIRYGLGLHMSDVPRETEVSMQKCGFTSQVLYPSSLGVIKLSIILFLLRVLPADHSWRRRLYALAAWVASSESAFTIALFLQCQPLNFYWDKTVQGSCFDQPKFYYVDASLNMATDVAILSLPWFIFRKLNLSRRRKYELLTVCSVGVFTLVSSIVRLPYLHNLNQSKDPTWDVVDIAAWSIAELGSAITLSSVPAIRPLFAHHFPGFMGSLVRTRDTASNKAPYSSAQRSKERGPFALPETNSTRSKPEWFSYTELDDVDDGVRKASRGGADSQENIIDAGKPQVAGAKA